MVKNVLLVLLAIVLLLLVAAIIWLVLHSKGELAPLQDGAGNDIPGALAEKDWVEIGGMKQGLFIRSENPENPVILFLHGGPGSPELPMAIDGESTGGDRLEKHFTVCYWDQRGAGMTAKIKTDPATMTLDRLVEDTLEVTDYLRERFGQDKIILMGHSWGSYLGVKTIQAHPDRYRAYVGIGQVSNQMESEKLAHAYMLAHAMEIGDEKAMKALEAVDVNAADFPSQSYLRGARSNYMNEYGIGMMREDASFSKVAMQVLRFGGYTVGEKFAYIKGMDQSQKYLFDDVTADNLFESNLVFEVPFYVAQGRWDYQVSHDLAQAYVEAVSAPEKGFYSLENSAHSPNFEEMDAFVELVKEIDARH